MLPIAWYLLKLTICSGILYGYYWLMLRNKVFHGYNRFYLLATVVLSLLLPLLQINWWPQNEVPHNQMIKILQVVASGNEYLDEVVIHSGKQHWAVEQLYPLFYLFISFLLLFVFIRTLYLIYTLLKNYPSEKIEGISFVNTEHSSTPFSFLKYIFWNAAIDLSTTQGRQIFKHEIAHIQERHTYDKLFINSVLILCWCNPFFWLIRKELNMIHEFIADKKAVEDSDTTAFAAMILQATYPQHNFNLTNNFFYSPIKRRLLMLTKNKSPRTNYIGRILVLPLAMLIVTAFTLKNQRSKAFSLYHGKKITVVVDAGHGGADAGAKSLNGIFEKDITLAIAKKVKELNNNDDIEILLARDNDIFSNVEQQVGFAKTNKADLFISIHCDAEPLANTNKHTGLSVWVPNDNNPMFAQSKQLATAVLTSFKEDFGLPVLNTLNQRNRPVYTLDKNICPAILIETGFITTPFDADYLVKEKNQEKIAENILKGIELYLSIPRILTTTDTIPSKLPTKEQWEKASTPAGKNSFTGNFNKDKALYVLNGKIIGSGREALEKVDKIVTVSVSASWLPKAEAIKKYGRQGEFGAYEIITSKKNDAIQVAADKISADDKNKNIILSGNVDLKGDLSKALIYVDGKLVSEDVFRSIDTKLIETVKIDASVNTKTKDPQEKISAIYVSLLHGGKTDITGVDSRSTNINSAQPTADLPGKAHFDNFSGSRIPLDVLLKTKSLVCENKNFKIKSAVVYFSGAGFKNAVMSTINSGDLSSLKSYIEKCTAGSVITFDNIRTQSAEEKIVVADGTSIVVYDNHDGDGNDNLIFNKVEVDPTFPGGTQGWRDYLVKNIKASLPVDEGWNAGTYTIIVQFIVHQDGTVSDVTTTNYPGSKTAQHCIDIIKNGPKWIPAIQNGRKVNAYRKQPISFYIEENK